MKYYRFLTGWVISKPWVSAVVGAMVCVCVGCWDDGGHTDMEQGGLPVSLEGSVCLSLGRGCEG